MGTKKDQHKVVTRTKPRGQQTGFAGNPDQNRLEMKKTPAISGTRRKANRMFADDSEQHIGGDSVTPSTNSPSTPAMHTEARGDAGGEGVFKKRLARKR